MNEHSQRGIILVTALWVVMLLALFAFVVVETTRAERHIGRNLVEQARLQAVAEAGVHRAIIALLDRASAKPWHIDGTPMTFSYGGTEMTIAIEDEFGKIDLNAATGDILAGLFASAGAENDRAEALAAAVEDWRDKDDLRHANGAERSDYMDAGRSYGPRNAALESRAELLQVKGMTRDLFERVRPALTVHSMRQFVDLQTAPRDALRVINDMARGNSPSAVGAGATDASTNSIVSLSGRAMTFRVEAQTERGERARKEVVVRFTDDSTRPYWIQEWRASP